MWTNEICPYFIGGLQFFGAYRHLLSKKREAFPYVVNAVDSSNPTNKQHETGGACFCQLLVKRKSKSDGFRGPSVLDDHADRCKSTSLNCVVHHFLFVSKMCVCQPLLRAWRPVANKGKWQLFTHLFLLQNIDVGF